VVWNSLGVEIIGSGLGAAASANTSSWASAVWRGTLKLLATSKAAVAVPVVMVALGAGALHYHRVDSDRAAESKSADKSGTAPLAKAASPAASAAQPGLAQPAAQELAADEVQALAADLPSNEGATHATPLAPAKDHLREESAFLERARALLRSGHPRAAQGTLLRMQAQFPKGSLTQEREVLLIEALAARGNSDAAERDARSFVEAHPESPHAVQLRRFLEHSNDRETRSN
jgi:TolA-binding protein